LKFGHPRVMALFLALTMFQHLINGFHNSDLRRQVAALLGVDLAAFGNETTGLPPPLRAALKQVDTEFEALIAQAVPLKKAS
jgi:hypothetical protein